MPFQNDVPSNVNVRTSRPRPRFTALALLEPMDFDAARHGIVDLENWATYDDYVCDREGLAMGLSAAGEDTRLITVSLRAFESWRRRTRVTPSVANLDVYAQWLLLRRGRANKPIAGGSENESDSLDGIRNLEMAVSIAVEAYMAWILCLRTLPFHMPSPSPEAYARLLLEKYSQNT